MKADSCFRSVAFASLFALPLALSPLAASPAAAANGAARFVRLAAPTRTVDLSVHFPLRNSVELDELIALQGDSRSPLFHHFLSVAQFRAAFGPTDQTFSRAEASLRARGFSVTSRSTQALRVRANVATVERAFGTRLGVLAESRGATRVAMMRPMQLTPELSALGATVSGLENLPRQHVHSMLVPLNRYSAAGPYWFTDLKEAYTYPSFETLNGKGATIGIVMSSDIFDSDIKAEFDHEHFSLISGKPVPSVIRDPVEGGAGTDSGALGEASVDTQTSLGSAPGAHEVLYDMPDLSNESTMAAYTQVDDEDVVDVVSSSFGECELYFTAAYNGGVDETGLLKAQHELFRQGNVQGITFLASSGDSSGLECTNLAYFEGKPGKFVPGVGEPADDPNVTAVGGTDLVTTAPATAPVLTSKYVSESEFGDPEMPYDPYGFGVNVSGGIFGSGSGDSKIWAKPAYQYALSTGSKTRAVPDVSMQMGGCPDLAILAECNLNVDSAGLFYVDGGLYEGVGTSLSSPEFAGLLAIEVGKSGRLGNVNPLLYKLGAKNGTAKPFEYFHQGIPGYNGVVRTAAGKKGYSPIVGLGTPNARMLLGVPSDPLALDPQTKSNP